MPRAPGARNRDHLVKKQKMCWLMADYLLQVLPEQPSLREFAPVAGVSVTNLRHYFPSKLVLYKEILIHYGEQQESYLQSQAHCFQHHPRQGMIAFLHWFGKAWSLHKIGHYHVFGLVNCSAEVELELTYQVALYRPLYQFVEGHIDVWMKSGMLRRGSVQILSEQLLSPALQRLLTGKYHKHSVSTKQWEGFVKEHVSTILTGWW